MKIRLPLPARKAPTRTPAPKKPPKLKLRAAIARSPRAVEEDDDYYDEPEPNMKLSHAFVVVLVLHVIAVAGVFAFSSIKSRQEGGVFAEPTAESVAPAAAQTAAAAPVAEEVNAPAPRPLTAAPERTVAAAPAAEAWSGKTHELAPGETLTRVSSQYGVSVDALQQANEITDPTKIRAGQTLKIPASMPTAAPVAAAPPAPKPAVAAPTDIADSGKTYEVVKGDNPVKIAKHLNVSYDALMKLNGIEDPRKLQIGQTLKVPAARD